MGFIGNRLQLVSPSSEDNIPLERSGHRLLVNSAALYSLGGYNPDVVDSDVEDEEELNQRIFVQMWKFSFFSRRWSEIKMTGDSPKFLASHTATLYGNTVFTFGGSGIPFGVMSSRDVHTCCLEVGADTVHWQRVNVTGEIPEKKYGHCQLFDWPYLYIVGGTTGYIYNMDVHRLDLRTCEWKCLWDSDKNVNASPVGRYRHEMILYDNKLLVFGGGQARVAFTLAQVPYFDLETERWDVRFTVPNPGDTEEGGYPQDRRCHSCVQYRDKVFIFGGRSLEAYGDVWSLDLRDFEWTCLIRESLSPGKLFFHGASVTSSGCMYVFGGVKLTDGERNGRSNGVEVRTNNIYKMWLVVPSLKELAWDVVSSQITGIPSPHLQTELINVGVPRPFVQRVIL